MHIVHELLVTTHIAIGSVALILFWVPIFTRKGGRNHVRIGRTYVYVMYAVVVTAFLASALVLYDPLATRSSIENLSSDETAQLATRARTFSLFLLMLSLLVYTSLQHGIRAVRARQVEGLLATPLHRTTIAGLFLLAVVVGLIGFDRGQVLLMVFGGIGSAGSIGMFRDTWRDLRSRNERIAAHLNALIGTGIGAYTAFFAFGGSRLFADLLPGQWQVVPWVLPSVIGTIAIRRRMKRYRLRQAGQTV